MAEIPPKESLIEYPSDFAAQQLELSAKYAFLPTYN